MPRSIGPKTSATNADSGRAPSSSKETLSTGFGTASRQAWARRIGGILAGHLARSAPGRAHAVLSPLSSGGWQVSVRSALERPGRAAAFCRRYASGGGREAAAGINRLPGDALARFAEDFLKRFARTDEPVSG